MGTNKEFISLKEAAKISGYSSDYIGQLIRSGKIEGKQVFSNVAWVTTEKDIKKYMEEKGSSKKDESSIYDLQKLRRFLSNDWPTNALKAILYFFIVFLVFFALFLFYVSSVSIDKSIERDLMEKVGQTSDVSHQLSAED